MNPHTNNYVESGGPMDKTLLRHQLVHRSEQIWQQEVAREHGIEIDCEDVVLKSRRQMYKTDKIKVKNAKFMEYLASTGFLGVWSIGSYKVDHYLITTMVERWRPETHTFHMTEGEMTITLQDVAILYGLPIDGLPITGAQYVEHWPDLCEQLLGRSPIEEGMHLGHKILISWLVNYFNPSDLGEDEPDVKVQQYVRANILRLIGSELFADKSDNMVHTMFLPFLADLRCVSQYSWGSACLGWLYRQLCEATDPKMKNIGGSMNLLQLWIWERVIPCRPAILSGLVHKDGTVLGTRWRGHDTRSKFLHQGLQSYRRVLDELKHDEIVWLPYTDEVIARLPSACLANRHVWMVRIPLLCFHVVEWHYPDRVFRQFGWLQLPPHRPEPDDGSHMMQLRGNVSVNWATYFKAHVQTWNNRVRYTVTGKPTPSTLRYHSKYMDWFKKTTRRFITPRGARKYVPLDMLECIHHATSDFNSMGENNWRNVHQMADSVIRLYEQRQRCRDIPNNQSNLEVPGQYSYDIPPEEQVPRTRRRRTISNTRKRIESVQPSRSDYHPSRPSPSQPIPSHGRPGASRIEPSHEQLLHGVGDAGGHNCQPPVFPADPAAEQFQDSLCMLPPVGEMTSFTNLMQGYDFAASETRGNINTTLSSSETRDMPSSPVADTQQTWLSLSTPTTSKVSTFASNQREHGSSSKAAKFDTSVKDVPTEDQQQENIVVEVDRHKRQRRSRVHGTSSSDHRQRRARAHGTGKHLDDH